MSGKADPEISAMGAILAALDELDDDARARVLKWAAAKFVVKSVGGKSADAIFTPEAAETAGPVDTKTALANFDTLGDAFAAAGPPSGAPERALVVAAYLHAKESLDEFTGLRVNSQLKHLGYPASNITVALSALQSRRPQLVIQTRKSGVSKQGKKLYKVTLEGMKTVGRMLAQTANPETAE